MGACLAAPPLPGLVVHTWFRGHKAAHIDGVRSRSAAYQLPPSTPMDPNRAPEPAGIEARLHQPMAVAVHPLTQRVFFSDPKGIRVIDCKTESTSTLIGNLREASRGLAVNDAGVLFASIKHRICRIYHDGRMSTWCGGNDAGFLNATGSVARFDRPRGIAFDSRGNLIVCDAFNALIRLIAPDGTSRTIAGSTKGYRDGVGQAAQFFEPNGIAIDKANDIAYITDHANHRVRQVNLLDGTVTTLAGSGSKSSCRDGIGTAADIRYPHSIYLDLPTRCLYVTQAHCLRKIQLPEAMVTTQAGTYKEGHTSNGVGSLVGFYYPSGIAMSPTARELILLDRGNHTIHRLPLPPLPDGGGAPNTTPGGGPGTGATPRGGGGVTTPNGTPVMMSTTTATTITIHAANNRSTPTSPAVENGSARGERKQITVGAISAPLSPQHSPPGVLTTPVPITVIAPNTNNGPPAPTATIAPKTTKTVTIPTIPISTVPVTPDPNRPVGTSDGPTVIVVHPAPPPHPSPSQTSPVSTPFPFSPTPPGVSHSPVQTSPPQSPLPLPAAGSNGSITGASSHHDTHTHTHTHDSKTPLGGHGSSGATGHESHHSSRSSQSSRASHVSIASPSTLLPAPTPPTVPSLLPTTVSQSSPKASGSTSGRSSVIAGAAATAIAATGAASADTASSSASSQTTSLPGTVIIDGPVTVTLHAP